MSNEERIVEYVVGMLKVDEVDLLLGRMEVLADLLHGMKEWEWDSIISVICKVPEKGAEDGEL